MEHRCFRPPFGGNKSVADSQSSFPFHLIPLCGNTISTRSFARARACMCISLSSMDGWRGGVRVFETIRGLKFEWGERNDGRSITGGNCYLAGINVDLRCLLI